MSSSSRRWLKEHFSDAYVKQAQKAGYRSRAIYKLQEIQDRDKLFRPGMTVIDLGAAPGSWSQLLVKHVGSTGRVIAVDILPMEPLAGVECIQADFSQPECADQLLKQLAGTTVDWVISDMAPNMSGIDSVDQPRSMELAELALDFALQLHAQGVLMKVFQGAGFDAFLKTVRTHFKKVLVRKPKASRSRSNEIYIIGRNT